MRTLPLYTTTLHPHAHSCARISAALEEEEEEEEEEDLFKANAVN